jgi:hypothetical protein
MTEWGGAMVVVRMVFRIRFGRGGEYAARFAAHNPRIMAELDAALGARHRWRLLTDRSGDFARVVIEVEVAGLAAWEQVRGVLFGLPAFQRAAAELHGLIEAGHSEFWAVAAEG